MKRIADAGLAIALLGFAFFVIVFGVALGWLFLEWAKSQL